MHVLACSASYSDAVRQTLIAGGENVGRAMLVRVLKLGVLLLLRCFAHY